MKHTRDEALKKGIRIKRFSTIRERVWQALVGRQILDGLPLISDARLRLTLLAGLDG